MEALNAIVRLVKSGISINESQDIVYRLVRLGYYAGADSTKSYDDDRNFRPDYTTTPYKSWIKNKILNESDIKSPTDAFKYVLGEIMLLRYEGVDVIFEKNGYVPDDFINDKRVNIDPVYWNKAILKPGGDLFNLVIEAKRRIFSLGINFDSGVLNGELNWQLDWSFEFNKELFPNS